MTTQVIDVTISTSSHPDAVGRTNISGLIFSCVMSLTGVIAFVSTFEIEDHSSTVSMRFMVFNTTLFLVGVSRLFWRSKEIVYLPTDSVTKEQNTFFGLKHLDELTDTVKSDDFSLQSTTKGGTSGGLHLDVVLSRDKKFAAVQLLQPIPCTCNPITFVRCFINDEAASITALLTKIKEH